jgi:THO complex subunit 2
VLGPIKEVFAAMDFPMAFHLTRAAIPPPYADADDAICQDLKEVMTQILDFQSTAVESGEEKILLAGLSWEFVFCFWRFSTYDISFPEEEYDKQLDSLDTKIAAVQKQITALEGHASRGRGARSDLRTAQYELGKLEESREAIAGEKDAHQAHYEKVIAYLDAQKDKWIPKASPQSTLALVKHCLAQRVLFSEADALYCAYFVRMLLKVKANGFQLLDFYNHWTQMLGQLMLCCTDREATYFGRFLNVLMADVLKLRIDQKLFESNAKDNCCYRRHYYDSQQMTHEELTKGHTKWEMRIFRALKPGLASDDWSERRNAMTVLTKTHLNCPVVEKVATAAIQLVELARDKEKERADLKLLAQSLTVQLKKVKDAGSWVDAKNPVERKEPPAEDRKEEKPGSKRAAPEDDRTTKVLAAYFQKR